MTVLTKKILLTHLLCEKTMLQKLFLTRFVSDWIYFCFKNKSSGIPKTVTENCLLRREMTQRVDAPLNNILLLHKIILFCKTLNVRGYGQVSIVCDFG